ncbi:MAG: efflux transporter outer membrane subunit, partial [Pacificimonas sp.]
IAAAGRRPQANASGSATRESQSGEVGGIGQIPGIPLTQSVYRTGIGADWEIDLFGRIARRIEAADARNALSEEDRNAVLLTAIADTVQNYTELRAAQAQAAAADENIAVAARTADLTRLLADQELASDFDVARSEAALSSARAARRPYFADIRARIAALAALTGTTPERAEPILAAARPLPTMLDAIPAGLPSDLLRRRPDVRLAERRLAAETADIGAEIADLYPRFSLSGMFGFASSAVENLFGGDAETWSVAGALNWPIFAGGRGRAEVDEARAGADEARALYSAAVVNAFRDAETALSAYVSTSRRRTELAETLASQERAYELGQLRFEMGLDSLLDLLDTQRRLIEARSALAAADRDLAVATVTSFRALGGGWEDALDMRAEPSAED